MRPRLVPRPTTVRARLTALYAGLFAATTVTVMVAVNVLLGRMVDRRALSLIKEAEGPDTAPPLGMPIPPDKPAPKSVHDLQDAIKDYQWTVTWIAAGLLAVIGAVVGWWIAGRVLRPVHRITAAAKRLSLSNLHERIALTGPRDELRELADTFDAMLERLERAADSQRRFAANASHELRTPLAIQRAAIEIGLDRPSPEQLARMRIELLEANLRTERLIEGLMTLAQGEREPENPEPVDLAAIAREAVAQHRGEATDASVTVDVDVAALPLTGDPVMLTRLVGNLVHNGIRYNYAGGRVAVRTSPSGGLTVSNTGPHVPGDRIPELFEPFRRLHAARTGTRTGAGLGLSIVSAIAAAHGAAIDARPNVDGGLTITLRFPAEVRPTTVRNSPVS